MTLNAVIEQCYACVASDDAMQAFLERLARHFGCPSAALVYIDATRALAAKSLGYGLFDQAAQKIYAERFAADDPAPAAMANLPVGQALSTDRLFDEAAKSASRFFTGFYRQHGMEEALGGPFARLDGQFGLLAVHRGPGRGPFTDDEIAGFEVILPHVAQMMALRRAFFCIAKTARQVNIALEATALATMVFGAGGLLGHANAAARRLLARRDGLALDRDGRLKAQDRLADGHLQRQLTLGAAADMPAILRIPRRGHDLPYVLQVIAAAEPDTFVVKVVDLSVPSAGNSPALASALGLSRAAARLVAALAGGEDMNAYARRSKISLNTAKYHLKAAFVATGASRQSELVRLASAVVQNFGTEAAAGLP